MTLTPNPYPFPYPSPTLSLPPPTPTPTPTLTPTPEPGATRAGSSRLLDLAAARLPLPPLPRPAVRPAAAPHALAGRRPTSCRPPLLGRRAHRHGASPVPSPNLNPSTYLTPSPNLDPSPNLTPLLGSGALRVLILTFRVIALVLILSLSLGESRRAVRASLRGLGGGDAHTRGGAPPGHHRRDRQRCRALTLPVNLSPNPEPEP